jgi:hypothetical protein
VPVRIGDLKGDVTFTALAEGDALVREGARWVNARGGGTYRPRVAGNGIANDWAVIQAALDAAEAAGGIVELPIGTFLIDRPLRLGSYVTLRGKGPGSVITRPASIVHALTSDVAANATVIPYIWTTGLAIGQAFAVWDDTSNALRPTFGIITGISPGVSVTIDTPCLTAYAVSLNAAAGTVFSLIRNKPNTSYIRVAGFKLDQNAISGDPVDIFQFSTLEWVLGSNCVVERNLFVRSICDCYSDQAGDYNGVNAAPIRASNHVRFNWFNAPRRYAMHWGTFMDGAAAIGNVVTGGISAVFWCAAILNTRVIGNYIRGTSSWAFIGLDNRDLHNLIEANTIAGCYGALELSFGSQFVTFSGNDVSDCTGPLAISGAANAQDCKIIGNRFTAASPASAGIGLTNCFRFDLESNTFYNFPATTGTVALALSGCTDITISDMTAVVGDKGVTIGGSGVIDGCVGVRIDGLRVVSPASGVGLAITGAANADISLDGLQFTGATTSWATRPTRLRVNGVGDNGAADPAVSGEWHATTDKSYNGTIVRFGTPTSYAILTDAVWTTFAGNIPESQVTGLVADLAAKAPLIAPTFTAASNTTPAVKIQGLSGQGTAWECYTSGGVLKFQFNFLNAFGANAGLILQNDSVPNIILSATGTDPATGGAIFFARAGIGAGAAGRVWQFFSPADTDGFGALNCRVGGSGGVFGFGIYINPTNMMYVATPSGVSGYLPPTVPAQLTVRAKDASTDVFRGISSADATIFRVDPAGGIVVGAGTLLKKVLSATATLDFGSTAAQSSADLTISVTGAVVGDAVAIGLPAAPNASTSFTGWVSAADTVKVRFNNHSAAAVDPASGTYRATVLSF